MPAWNELLGEMAKIADPTKGGEWLKHTQTEWLKKLSEKRGGRNVLFYASAFLQKPQVAPIFLQISHEDINGFMSVMYGMDWSRNLTLVLHTPGGVTNATETIVEYLHQKFSDIEVIVPTYAMSAGTMISLASNRIVLGRQSQLGPIDPQMPGLGRVMSARAIVDQFESAKEAITGDRNQAAVWAPILQSLGPSLLTEAKNALEYGENMVARWLERRHFAGRAKAKSMAKEIARYFNRSENHKSHGRRIDRDEARSHGLSVEDLENPDDAELQDIVLTNYHLGTLIFEKSPCVKFLASSHNRAWIKNA
jgi:hypothetical protein